MDNRVEGFRLHIQGKDGWSPHELNGLLTHHRWRFGFPDPFNVGRNDQDQFRVLTLSQLVYVPELNFRTHRDLALKRSSYVHPHESLRAKGVASSRFGIGTAQPR